MTQCDQPLFSVEDAYAQIQEAVKASPSLASPTDAALRLAKAYGETLPETGLGDQRTFEHLLKNVTPGLNGQNLSNNYYGFVTGSVLPIATSADNLVTAYDQNVQVHLPAHSISTTIEHQALIYLLQLLSLSPEAFLGRTFTTGATSSNILGLACGREWVVAKRLEAKGLDASKFGVSPCGLIGACIKAGVERIQVITTMGHSSLYKATSVVGIGRSNLIDIGVADEPWRFDMARLEQELKRKGTASIIAISCGEVNTGRYATSSLVEMQKIRRLADEHQAWIHVDGAFGLFAACLPQFPSIYAGTAGIHLADSITSDAHKLLNVPYDCGIFFTRSISTLSTVCSNGNAAYLSPSNNSTAPANSGPQIASPLNIGIENSRRFRALPVYSVLLSLGRTGLAAMFERQILLARAVARYVHSHPAYELLPSAKTSSREFNEEDTGIIVLFRAKDEGVNVGLLEKINGDKTIYCSGSVWEGRKAVRLAVSTWRVDVERDLHVVKRVLDNAIA